MSEQDDQKPHDFADALHALSEGAQSDGVEHEDEPEEQILAGFDPAGRALRPLAPQRNAPVEPQPGPAHGELSAAADPTRFDQLVEDEDLAVPAASSESLASPSFLRAGNRAPTQPRSLTVQRTIIPIFLTLTLLLPGLAIWLLTLSEDAQLRAAVPHLPIYLFSAAAATFIFAVVNMLLVRSRQRAARVARDDRPVLE